MNRWKSDLSIKWEQTIKEGGIYMQDKIKRIEELARRKGKKELLMFLKGEKISKSQAILAKCYECMGYYIDGGTDCCVKSCPLYTFMPFKDKP